ncbi:hypothetical protein GCM10009605_06660 [Nocardiopsis composta]
MTNSVVPMPKAPSVSAHRAMGIVALLHRNVGGGRGEATGKPVRQRAAPGRVKTRPDRGARNTHNGQRAPKKSLVGA